MILIKNSMKKYLSIVVLVLAIIIVIIGTYLLLSSYLKLSSEGTIYLQSYNWNQEIDNEGSDEATSKKAVGVTRNYIENIEDYDGYIGAHAIHLMVNNVTPLRCPDCWEVIIDYDVAIPSEIEVKSYLAKVTINQGEVSDVEDQEIPSNIISENECKEIMGRVVDLRKENSCKVNEENHAQVENSSKLLICCIFLE